MNKPRLFAPYETQNILRWDAEESALFCILNIMLKCYFTQSFSSDKC